MPPPIGSMRMTSAPTCAIVMPPSGAATKAESSTIRRSAKSRFIAAPPFPSSDPLSRNKRGAVTCRRGRGADQEPNTTACIDAAGQECEDPGDDQRTEEQAQHRALMLAHIVLPCPPHRERQHHQGKDRSEVDRAKRTPQADRVNKERAQ